MTGSYSPLLVVFSLVVAVLASYTALGMATRLVHARGVEARWWLAGGTLAMGLGIWSMHFIGMLALRLPVPTGYDLPLTAISLAASLAASGYALWLTAREQLRWPTLLLGGLVMGSGIAAMHYIGMAALRMAPGIDYDPFWLGASLLVALLTATAALWLAHRLRTRRKWRLLAALIMGLAITGMHYTGMAAARFAEGSVCMAVGNNALAPDVLAAVVIASTLAVLGVALLAALLDQQMRRRTRYLDAHLSQARQRLELASVHDPLTGLPNRSLLADRITQAIAKAAGQHRRLAVLLINLQGFRSINAVHGHAAGDEMLITLAARMKQALEPSQTLARLGGIEFAVLARVGMPEEAALLAQRLQQAIASPIILHAQPVAASASIGIALYPDDGDDERSLIAHASTAMTHCRQGLHGGHAFFTPAMQESADHQLRLLQDLRMALERDELLLHYQPKLMAAGHPVIGAEALLRWQHPELGLLMPDTFIPIAECSGLILPIGAWVLDQACSQLSQWHAAGHPDWTMAVNLSAVQFGAPDLVACVAEALQRHCVPAPCLTLEVTESTAMRDVEASLKILGELTDMGVRISIDDFGTGYSSLLYLKRMPATELKIDRAFVRDLDKTGEDAAIVSSIIALGRTLQMRIVAEGVETADQRSCLDAMGCDQLQGYHFNPPLDAHTFASTYCAAPSPAAAEPAISA